MIARGLPLATFFTPKKAPIITQETPDYMRTITTPLTSKAQHKFEHLTETKSVRKQHENILREIDAEVHKHAKHDGLTIMTRAEKAREIRQRNMKMKQVHKESRTNALSEIKTFKKSKQNLLKNLVGASSSSKKKVKDLSLGSENLQHGADSR